MPATASAADRDGYIVTLRAAPLASYTGGAPGLAATSPRVTGRKLDRSSGAAREYRAYLAGRQDAALARLRGAAPDVEYAYRTALAGFFARLTTAQARVLRAAPEVARVERDARRQTTSVPPGRADALLGGRTGDGAGYLRLPSGLWQRLGGTDHAGEGVIVGIIDTGVTPEHPSFADDGRGYLGPAYAPPAVWDGACQAGDRFSVTDCGAKLIGARSFVEGFGRDAVAPDDPLSPRDADGHGTHVASTAAGNFGVDPSIDGNDLGVDRISGIAPRAYVAAYKACWVGATEPDGCSESDLVAAIDAAVADGVDVINYSIGGPNPLPVGADELAMLGASDAGVFVANSAGNDGPGPATINSPTRVPWLTAVAASTLARTFEATATVIKGAATLKVAGGSVTKALPRATLIDAAEAGKDGVTAADAELCLPDSLDPAKVAGAAVLCKRGVNARVEKSKVVDALGGVGMILYNANRAEEILTDTYWVPAVHISLDDGLKVKALAAGGGATASITAGRTKGLSRGAVLAAFSSRGPQTSVPDIARPDLTAPGVNILAGASPSPSAALSFVPGQLFQSISGTSMSSPHVAGAAALLTQLHPLFSPAAIKSSLMTTANPDVLKEDGATPATPFDTGSGEVDPNRAADPGLVVDAGTRDYLSFLRGVAPDLFDPGDPTPVTPPANLNLPSISFGTLTGRASTSRRFTSVDSTAQRWTVAVQGLPGITATPSVTRFTIAPGQTQEVGIELRRADAPLDEYSYGALVLRNGGRTVRLPISVRPVALSAPARLKVTTDAASGSLPFSVQSGLTGPLSGLGWGLARPQTDAGQRISATSGAPDLSGTDPGTQLYPVTVPAGSQLLAARLTKVDEGDPSTDIDLYLFRDPSADGDYSDAELIAFSASISSAEEIVQVLPDAGSYVFAVVGFTTRSGGSAYDFTKWLVADPRPDDPEPPPGIVVTGDPVAATLGNPAPLTLKWSAVDPPGTYLGVATYHDSADPTLENLAGLSLVEIERTAGPSGRGSTLEAGSGPASPTGGQDKESTPVTAAPAAGGERAFGTTAPLKVSVRSVRLRGRTLTIALRSITGAAIAVKVTRGSRTVGSGRGKAGTRAVKVRLRQRPSRGRYTVRVTVRRGATTASAVRQVHVR